MFACCSGRPPQFDYLIVGGGNAAGYACQEFVKQGLGKGELAMIKAEPVVPYERPALTKAYLHPPSAKARARLPGFHTCVGGGGERQEPAWYESQGIQLIDGKATEVDLSANVVKVGKQQYGYGKLILATGCASLRVGKLGVQGDDLPNVLYIRDERDAAKLVQALEGLNGKGRAVVVGGGYIGLECAAAMSGWGCDTTMVYPGAHVMKRLFDAELAGWMEEQYTARGVRLMKGDVAAEFVANSDGRAASVRLKSGTSLPCDLVVVGVGASPVVDYCAGLKMDKGGFAVDAFMQTSDPDVYAVGDVCAFPSRYGGTMRCEHVDHARKSAAQAVRSAMGLETSPYGYLPYFYSRVFEYSDAPIVFNFFGDQSGECEVSRRGENSIGAIWVKDGKVTGALLMGRPGPSAEDQDKLREMVLMTPAASDPASVFEKAQVWPRQQ